MPDLRYISTSVSYGGGPPKLANTFSSRFKPVSKVKSDHEMLFSHKPGHEKTKLLKPDSRSYESVLVQLLNVKIFVFRFPRRAQVNKAMRHVMEQQMTPSLCRTNKWHAHCFQSNCSK